MTWRFVCKQEAQPSTPQIPHPRRLYGAPGECEISTRLAGTKAAKGDTVHVILPGLKGPDTLWASSCGPEQVLGTDALCTCSTPPAPPTRATIKAHNGCQ